MQNDVGKGGVEILIKEELCESVVEIQKKSDQMMTMRLIFGEEMIQVICVYAPHGKPDIQKDKFIDELVQELDMKGTKELTLEIGDFNGHTEKKSG